MPKLTMVRHRITTAPASRIAAQPKRTAAHYGTAAHKRWHDIVIARAGGACQDCGRTGVRLFADHVVELRDGGAALDPANGRARCGSCHSTKTSKVRKGR